MTEIESSLPKWGNQTLIDNRIDSFTREEIINATEGKYPQEKYLFKPLIDFINNLPKNLILNYPKRIRGQKKYSIETINLRNLVYSIYVFYDGNKEKDFDGLKDKIKDENNFLNYVIENINPPKISFGYFKKEWNKRPSLTYSAKIKPESEKFVNELKYLLNIPLSKSS